MRLTVFLLLALPLLAFGQTPTEYKACQNPTAAPPTHLSCQQGDLPLGMLYKTRDGINLSLAESLDRIQFYQSFMTALKTKVLTEINLLKSAYENISECPEDTPISGSCEKALLQLRMAIRKDWPEMVTNLSIAQPTQVDPAMMHTKESRFTSRPAHLFRGATKILPLSHDQQNESEDVFLQRLAQSVPEVRALLENQKGEVRIVALSEKEKNLARNAYVKIRSQAQQQYLEIVKQNPILTFIGDVDLRDPDSPSRQHLKLAAKKFLSEIETELAALDRPIEESHKILLTYKDSAEALLKLNPSWCQAAESAAKVNRRDQMNRDLKVAAVQIGASVVAMGTCSTVILCGAAAGILGATDYHLTQGKADENFRRGIIQSATGESKETLVTSAQQNQSAAASLALSAIGVVTSGVGAVRSTSEKTAKALSTWEPRVKIQDARGSALSNWKPRNTADVQSYSSLHIREVEKNANRFFLKNRELLEHVTPKHLQTIRRHDLPKVLEFSELAKNYGYRGVPKEIVSDLFEFGEFATKKSRDGKYIEMSIADSLKLLWGHHPGGLETLAQQAKTTSERAHWHAMLRLRQHVIEAMNGLDKKIMHDAYAKIPTPTERVELRFIEFIADLSARRTNPMTKGEFGRTIIPTGEFLKKMGRENLVQKIAGDSAMEVHAARKFLDKMTMDEVAAMATELEGAYKSSGLPTSLSNTILFRLHGR